MRKNQNQLGMSLLEVMIATSIFGFVSLQSYSVVTNMTKQKNVMERKFSVSQLEAMIKSEMDKKHFYRATNQRNSTLAECAANYDKCPKAAFGINLYKKRNTKFIPVSGSQSNNAIRYDKSGGLVSDTKYAPKYRIFSSAKAIRALGTHNNDKRPETINILVTIEQLDDKNKWKKRSSINKTWDIRPRSELRAAKRDCGQQEGYYKFVRNIYHGSLDCSWIQTPSNLPANFTGEQGNRGKSIVGDRGDRGNDACKQCTGYTGGSNSYRLCGPC